MLINFTFLIIECLLIYFNYFYSHFFPLFTKKQNKKNMSSEEEEGLSYKLLKRLIKTFKYKYEEELDSGQIVEDSLSSFDEEEQDDILEVIDWMDDFCEEYTAYYENHDFTFFKHKSMISNDTTLEIILNYPDSRELLIKITVNN